MTHPASWIPKGDVNVKFQSWEGRGHLIDGISNPQCAYDDGDWWRGFIGHDRLNGEYVIYGFNHAEGPPSLPYVMKYRLPDTMTLEEVQNYALVTWRMENAT